MLRASQKAASANAAKLIAAIMNSTLVRLSNGARASASDRERVATTSVFSELYISIRRVTTSLFRRASMGTVLTMSVHRPAAFTDSVTARPVMPASSRAAFSSSSKPMAIHATGRGLRTSTATSW